ncbi:MAG: hypothetical protein MPL62_11315, partial [Alphaproteobacteria bacterium]|nr:hypothetical protein [Alphaproteobacteria bacterium]
TAGAVCGAVFAVRGTAETAEVCRFLPSENFVSANQKNAAPSMKPSKQILILRASPHPSAGTARLSQHRRMS